MKKNLLIGNKFKTVDVIILGCSFFYEFIFFYRVERSGSTLFIIILMWKFYIHKTPTITLHVVTQRKQRSRDWEDSTSGPTINKVVIWWYYES